MLVKEGRFSAFLKFLFFMPHQIVTGLVTRVGASVNLCRGLQAERNRHRGCMVQQHRCELLLLLAWLGNCAMVCSLW